MNLEHIPSARDEEDEQAEAIRFGDFVFVRTQLGWGADGSISNVGDFPAQFNQAFQNLDSALATAGGSLNDVVRIRYPLTDGRNYIDCRRIRNRIWPEHGPPATVVICSGLPNQLALGGVEAIAYLGKDREVVEWTSEFARRDNTPDYSPEVRGKVGFSPATTAGGLAFLAGQVALDERDDYVALGQPSEQTRYAHENNVRVLSQLGLTTDSAIKFFNFLTYPQYADAVGEVTGQFFPHRPPASTIVAALGWPGNIIESEITAALGEEVTYYPETAFASERGVSGAVQTGHLLFTAGIAPRSSNGELIGPGDGTAQLEQVFSNLLDLLTAAGTEPSKLLMLNVYLAANTLFDAWNGARTAFWKRHVQSGVPFPPHSVYSVPALPSFEHLVQLEAIAAVE